MLSNEQVEVVIYNLTIHRHRCREHGAVDHIHDGYRWQCLVCRPELRPAGGGV